MGLLLFLRQAVGSHRGTRMGKVTVESSSSWSSRLLADSARPKDLKELVLSVAQHHLKTIELFGAIIGFFIGVGQAIYFWFTYHPR